MQGSNPKKTTDIANGGFKILFEKSNHAILTISPTGKILDANAASLKITGYDKHIFLSKSLWSILPEFPLKHGKIETSESGLILTHLLNCKGIAVPVEINLIEMKEEPDHFFFIVINDIHERKMADTIRDISSTLTASLDISQVYDLLLVQLSRLIPYDGGNVMTVENHTAHISRIYGYREIEGDFQELLLSMQFDIHNTTNISHIFQTGKPLIIRDTRTIKDWQKNKVSEMYRSWIGAPVIINGKPEAIFSLDKIETDYFTEEHAELLATFSNQAALAIKNAKLYSEVNQRVQEMNSLQATLKSINSELDLDSLLEEIVDRAVSLLNVSIGELGLYDPQTKKIKIQVSKNPSPDYVGKLIDLGKGVMGKAAKLQKPVNVDNYLELSEDLPEYTSLGAHASMAVPMIAGKKLIGVLSVGKLNSLQKFSENDIQLLSNFAEQATIAIQNARLFDIAKKRAEEAETLRKASSAVTASLNQTNTIDLILQQLALVVPYDSASVLLQKKDELSIVGGRGFSNAAPVIGSDIPISRENPGAIVFLDKKTTIIDNIEELYPNFNALLDKNDTIRSWLGVPLIIQDRTIGILSIDSHQPHRYTEDHAKLVSAFADQVALALENTRLYTDMVRSSNRFETLYHLSQTIAANIRSEEIYSAIHKAVSELMTTEFFSIALFDQKTKMINEVYMMDNLEPLPLSSRPIGTGLYSQVLLTGKSILYNSFDDSLLQSTGAILVDGMDDKGYSQSILVVPLSIGNTRIGVLSAQSYLPNMYSDTDREMLELLGSNAAVALDNARLFSEVQKLAITDPLTQLFNRRKFYELGNQEFDRSRRYHRPLCAIMLDLDLFKNVNDTFGHAVGDQVLTELAQLCKDDLRSVDVLARFGGEEFVILLPETNLEEAYSSAERIRLDTEGYKIETNAGKISITISLGVVQQDETCKNLEELLDRSDQALYASKRNGRNRTTCWKPEFSPAPLASRHVGKKTEGDEIILN